MDAAEALDVHTHLFAFSYGNQLMQYGIDAMLSIDSTLACSSELVAQYLAVATETFGEFEALPRSVQVRLRFQLPPLHS